MIGERTTVYRTYVKSRLAYTGPDLEAAIRMWDNESLKLAGDGIPVPGGVAVATYEEMHYGLLQLRDGWILHVHEDGAVYLNPSLKDA